MGEGWIMDKIANEHLYNAENIWITVCGAFAAKVIRILKRSLFDGRLKDTRLELCDNI